MGLGLSRVTFGLFKIVALWCVERYTLNPKIAKEASHIKSGVREAELDDFMNFFGEHSAIIGGFTLPMQCDRGLVVTKEHASQPNFGRIR